MSKIVGKQQQTSNFESIKLRTWQKLFTPKVWSKDLSIVLGLQLIRCMVSLQIDPIIRQFSWWQDGSNSTPRVRMFRKSSRSFLQEAHANTSHWARGQVILISDRHLRDHSNHTRHFLAYFRPPPCDIWWQCSSRVSLIFWMVFNIQLAPLNSNHSQQLIIILVRP